MTFCEYKMMDVCVKCFKPQVLGFERHCKKCGAVGRDLFISKPVKVLNSNRETALISLTFLGIILALGVGGTFLSWLL